MRKDWVLIIIVGLILVIGFGLYGFMKLSKKDINANPVPSSSVSNTSTSTDYFSEDAKVMYFYSDFCHWCQKEKDEVLSVIAKDGYKVKPMNVGNSPDLGTQYNVTGTPTFIAANGDRLVGFQTADVLKKFLDEHK